MASIYVDLVHWLVGWAVLLLTTFSLSLVPNATLLWSLPDDSTSTSAASPSVIFGAWVLAEFMLLVVLVTMATVLMYCCKKMTPTVGLLQLIADPVLVPLACVPVLIMCGVPIARSLRLCLHNIETNTTDECTSEHMMNWNLDSVDRKTLWRYEHELMTLEGCLQCICVLPVFIRLTHLRWRMAWQPFLLSAMVLVLQAFDVGCTVHLALIMGNEVDHRAAESWACLSALFVGAASLSIATPPVYLGRECTAAYLRWLLIGVLAALDVPGFALKLRALLMPIDALLVPNVSSLFFFCLMKNICSIMAGFILLLSRLRCRRGQYASLDGNRRSSTSDTQRLCPQTDHEDFV